jgi:hypothetical protein
MISAADSSVLLDVLCDDPVYGDASSTLLRRGMAEGRLIVGECVIAELRPTLGEEALRSFMDDWGVVFVPSTLDSALLAGRHFSDYLRRGGTARRVLPDFLIGAHAQVHADRLLARDRGYQQRTAGRAGQARGHSGLPY